MVATEVLLLLHVPPGTELVKVVVAPVQAEKVPEMLPGVGFTVTVKVLAVPTQLAAVGVTVNTPAVGEVPELVAVNGAIDEPEPLAPMPMVVLLLAQV